MTAARAQRDAAAAAMRRQSGTDPVQIARRIAAALNAPPSVPDFDWNFVWATALTVDGTIVVANSYGLAYIPAGVNLPTQVRMATADESIPPGERAKWAAYPYLALQGWAQHTGTSLRAVFGTDDQLQGIDPGAPKIILLEQDIPPDGTMQGRSRLEVVAPEAAARLASVRDADLTNLLPLRPADDTPPADNTDALWFDMLKPLMQSGTGTEIAHLEAFVAYANNEYELALHRAHTAPDAVAQRAAIADWVYWQHVSVLVSDGLVGSAPKG
ncbi:secretion protein EccK [Mycolicibacterium wolinskyi]|uniref:Secretion protein EccK n=2 Tax=Mycobacteriaceae TaxID=1762 RepID=A0A1X2ESQ2_9MYCO|nr:secretion protein EccK [Mycolicibacterium wolinskyi]